MSFYGLHKLTVCNICDKQLIKETMRGAVPMLHKITARLNLGSVSSGGKSCLGDLHWSLLLQNTQLDQLNVLFHVEYLLQDL